MEKRKIGVADFDGIHGRIGRLSLPPNLYQTDENGSRFTQGAWGPRTGLTRLSFVPKKPARINGLFSFVGMDGDYRVMTAESSGQVQGFQEGISAGPSVSLQIHNHDFSTLITAGAWILTLAPGPGLYVWNDDPGDKQEGVASLHAGVNAGYLGGQDVELSGGILPPPFVNLSGFTACRVWVRASIASTVKLRLVDTAFAEAESTTVNAMGPAWSEVDFPLSEFGAINLSQVFLARYRFQSAAVGPIDWRFDDLRAIA